MALRRGDMEVCLHDSDGHQAGTTLTKVLHVHSLVPTGHLLWNITDFAILTFFMKMMTVVVVMTFKPGILCHCNYDVSKL